MYINYSARARGERAASARRAQARERTRSISPNIAPLQIVTRLHPKNYLFYPHRRLPPPPRPRPRQPSSERRKERLARAAEKQQVFRNAHAAAAAAAAAGNGGCPFAPSPGHRV